MSTFIIFVNWTDQGIQAIKESPSRLDGFKHAAESMGCQVKAFYLVAGEYDMIVVLEAPDGEPAVKLSLATNAKGSVRTKTLQAFAEDEYRGIIAGLP